MPKYKTTIKLCEAGITHEKGQELKVSITEERAQNLIRAGYIEEVETQQKNFEAPQTKDMKPADVTKKAEETEVKSKPKKAK